MPDSDTKRENFSRLFPPAVEKLVDRLRVIKQKSVKSSYEWDQALVYDAWVQIGIVFCQTAEAFGVKFELIIDGDEVQWAKPKSKQRKK